MYVTCCQLTLHENVFYATREIGRLYETGRYLHNYGLAYALGFVHAPYNNTSAVPRYQQDLPLLNDAQIYVTPARPLEVTFELNTFKYADNRYRVKMEPSSRNVPTFGRAKELAVGSTFEFMIVSVEPPRLPHWVRLGKWMGKAALAITCQEEVNSVSAAEFISAVPLNPLDGPTSLKILAYDLISMPPVSLLDHVTLIGEHYRLADGRRLPAQLAYRFPTQ